MGIDRGLEEGVARGLDRGIATGLEWGSLRAGPLGSDLTLPQMD